MEIKELINELEDTELVLNEAQNIYKLANDLFKQASRGSNKEGMMVADYYLAYYYVYFETNMVKACQYANSCTQGALELNDDKYIMLSHFIKSSVNIANLEPYDAIDAIIIAIRLAKKYDNKFIISICHNNIGDIFSMIDDHEEALKYYELAKREADDYAISKDLIYQKILFELIYTRIVLKMVDSVDRIVKQAMILFEDNLAEPFRVVNEITKLMKSIEYIDRNIADDIYNILLLLDGIEDNSIRVRLLFILKDLVISTEDKGLYDEYCFMCISYSKLSNNQTHLKQAYLIKNLLLGLGDNTTMEVLDYAMLVSDENAKLSVTTGKSLKRIIALNQAELERDSEIEKNRKLQELSNTDGLTNLYNRRYFENLIDDVLKDVTKKDFAFIIIDVDKFKDINDTYGHSIGDQALVFISNALRKSFDSDSYICRLGGDEFVVLLYNLPTQYEIRKSVVAYRLDALQQLLKNTPLDFLDNANISVSCGATIEGGNFEDLYSKADVALYDSKYGGRGTYNIFSLKQEEAE